MLIHIGVLALADDIVASIAVDEPNRRVAGVLTLSWMQDGFRVTGIEVAIVNDVRALRGKRLRIRTSSYAHDKRKQWNNVKQSLQRVNSLCWSI
jgi:hypothetical protein